MTPALSLEQTALRLFRHGHVGFAPMDTFDIGQFLGLSEAYVQRLLWQARHREWMQQHQQEHREQSQGATA